MKKSNLGFTLSELLIVVAIIAVLVAVSVPIFTTQLEKSREATDLANVRSAYALIKAAVSSNDKKSEYEGVPIYRKNEDVYMIDVSLKQKEDGWTTKEGLAIGEITSDDSVHWLDEPYGGGVCRIYYSKGELFIDWGCSEILSTFQPNYDYLTSFKNAINQVTVVTNCYNSTCSNHSAIKSIANAISKADEIFANDIKTWTAVRSPKDKTKDDYCYVMSTFSIDKLEAGTKIPALYMDKTGYYLVGYATVNAAPDPGSNGNKPYNVISIDPNGKYPCSSKIYDVNYQPATLISEGVKYTTATKAGEAYNKLVGKYLKLNTNMKEE
ncbi:MAG: type II secretion system protein [Clostridiales bacterium]|nr:type II secretion system protein [Clostridiales bacterium]